MIRERQEGLITAAVAIGIQGVEIPPGIDREETTHLFRALAISAVEAPGDHAAIRFNLRRNHPTEAKLLCSVSNGPGLVRQLIRQGRRSPCRHAP